MNKKRNRYIPIIVLILLIIGGVIAMMLINSNDNNNGSIADDDYSQTTQATEQTKDTTSSDVTEKKKPETKLPEDSEIDDDSSTIDAFVSLGYYNPSLRQRYIDYKAKNENMAYEQAILNVNIGIDLPFYTNVKKIEDPNSITVLVNKYNALPSKYEPSDLRKLDSRYSNRSTNTMRNVAAVPFEKMCADAAKQGYFIKAQSTYRSYSYQKNLYDRYLNNDPAAVVDTYSARAGQSEHQTGLVADVIGSKGGIDDFGRTKESSWMIKNAHKYGFIIRYTKEKVHLTGYTPEPWHVRYVGVDIATKLYNEKICFEEYHAKYLQ